MAMEFLSNIVARFARLLDGSSGPVLIAVFIIICILVALIVRPSSGQHPASPAASRRGQAGNIEDHEGYVLGEKGVQQQEGVALMDGENESDEGEQQEARFVPYEPVRFDTEETLRRSVKFYQLMSRRRTVRGFSDRPVAKEVIENIILTAGTAPSGAHTEPWSFVVVSDPGTKAEIRHITETEEQINYERRMGDRWVQDLRKLNTQWHKPYLEQAPYLILVFVRSYGIGQDGRRQKHYYHQISVAVSTGFMLAAIQNAGLVTVVSTPMNAGIRFHALLERPPNEKFFMLLPVGFPPDEVQVPDLHRKSLDEISVWI